MQMNLTIFFAENSQYSRNIFRCFWFGWGKLNQFLLLFTNVSIDLEQNALVKNERLNGHDSTGKGWQFGAANRLKLNIICDWACIRISL